MTNIHICLFACHTSFYNSLRTAFLPKVTNFRQLSVLQEKSLGRQSNFVALNDSLSAFCQVQPVSVIRDSCSWLVGTLIGSSPGRLLFRLPRCPVSQLPWLSAGTQELASCLSFEVAPQASLSAVGSC